MIVTVTIFILTVLKTADYTLGLIELPLLQDHGIFTTETAIRNITNRLFDHLQLRPSKTQTTRLKQFSTVHNYLVSLTLKDYDNLKEIAKIVRADNENDKAEQFIGVINEILNELPEDNNNVNLVETDVDRDVIIAIGEFLNNLEFLKQTYSLNKGVNDLNKEHFQHLQLDHAYDFNSNADLFSNFTFHENDSEEDEANSTVSDAGEFWEPSGRRIFKGERTKIKYFPFMASVQIFGQFQCAGSIIKSDLVITAASCLQLAYNNRFYRENPKFLSVRVGSSWYQGGGEVITVLEVYFYPTYDPKTLRDNVAIMRLHRWIKFSKHRKRVKKIRLDKHDHPLPLTTNGIAIAGWGAKSASNVIRDPWVNQLAYAILDVYGLEDCKDVYTSTYVTKKNFCAGFMSKGGGACNKDVGGPGIVDGVLTGIISFGSPVCGAADTPTVFTKVGFYYDWIEGIMEQPVARNYAKTTAAYYSAPVFEASIFTTTREPVIGPITSTRSTQFPTWQLSEELITKSGLLSKDEKERLFEEFLNSVFESEEQRGKKKNQDFSLLRLENQMAKVPGRIQPIETEMINAGNVIGNTQAIDVNDPLIAETSPWLTQITQSIAEENEAPVTTSESYGKSGVTQVLNGGATEAVPDSVELERDNAQITDEMQDAVGLSDEDTSPNEAPDHSESSEGLSLASFEDLTLRQANQSEMNKIFDIPKENLYDLISDRLSQAGPLRRNNSEFDRKRTSSVKTPVIPRRNVQRIMRYLS